MNAYHLIKHYFYIFIIHELRIIFFINFNNICLFSLFSYDSDFDEPESEPHQDDENFDKEDYLKWKNEQGNDEDDE